MTGRERVRRCLTFDSPDRAPRDLWALPYISLFRKDEFDAVVEKFPMDIGLSQLSPGWDEKVTTDGVPKHRPSEMVAKGLVGFLSGYGHEDIMLRKS